MKDFIVNDEKSLEKMLSRVRTAQEKFASYTQEQVDKIFFAAAAAADKARITLAKMAVEETGMGVFEDKVIKNHYAAEYIYNKYKDAKTCGVIERDEAFGYTRIAEPIGVLAAVIPTTNPTSTAIFKALICLKTRNGLIISPHPRAKKCTIEAAKVVLEAAVKAGAPDEIIGWIDEPSVALSGAVMREADTILATGGPGMVKAAYSSGKPAIGVGAGNTPAVVDASADIPLAVSSILHSKTFDNGMICASEQSVIVAKEIYAKFKKEMQLRGAYFLSSVEAQKVRKTIIVNGALNAKIVGQSAHTIAALSGFEVPEDAKVLVGEVTSVEPSEEFSHEKLSPVLAMYKAESFEDALDKADRLVREGGPGHTSAIYIDERTQGDRLSRFRERMQTYRVLVNTPAAQGGIGDLYNFRLSPSLTLGCGSRGGNSVSENVGVGQLINVKTVAERRENMLWFRAPEKVYFKRGSLRLALEELGEKEYGKKRAFVVTDEYLYNSGMVKEVTKVLDAMNVTHMEFFDVTPDPTLACARAGAELMKKFKPDVIVALGGGSPMDAAKIMWVLYEHPEADFQDLAMRFMDIRKRVYSFPRMGDKAMFVAVPTTAGTGSEVTPFAVITDERTGMKYPLADYELMPDVAVIDAELMMNIPKGLTSCAGIDSLSHALEAVASVMASDFTNGIAKEAIRLIFEYLPDAYTLGAAAPLAREKMAHAASMAGMAFANAFLGVCHSMAHKLGSYWHLPHGMANSLLLEEVIRFNSADAPRKMGTFPQYAYPECKRRYADVARYIGCKGGTDDELVEELIGKMKELQRVVGQPSSIREAIGDKGTEAEFKASLEQMSEDAFDDQCTGANPRYPLISEIRKMYLNAYYGKHEPV
ncbi:MAG: bifunctional acetaldehyde-CoA/alcohol dehydrogenase [Christensenellaceae bacterium]|nr:MAG: bifunctional acetaldehyde-CoA/alcohol dehydrogenase [Clostridiales bacterium]